MDDDRVGLLERLATAMVSGRLKLHEDGATDLDYIIALGMAAQRVAPEADALLRLYLAMDRQSYEDARGAAVRIARRLDTRRGWNLMAQDLSRIAGTALKYHINPICPECIGRKFQLAPNTPMLSHKVCKRCHGSGRRPIPIRNGRQIAEVIAALESIEHVAEKEIRLRMRRG